MTFDEWWATKGMEKVELPDNLKTGIKNLAHEAWWESRDQQNLTTRQSRAADACAHKNIIDCFGGRRCEDCGAYIPPPA